MSDFRPADLGAAIALGLVVLASAGLTLQAAAAERPARAVVAPEVEHAVRVTPVMDVPAADAPLLKLGGRPDPTRLPDRAARQAPKARVERGAEGGRRGPEQPSRELVSERASKAADEAPPPEVKMASASAPPPPPDVEVTKRVDAPVPIVADAGAPANVAEAGHADGVKEGTETDPLKARAVDLYRARIASWLSNRFRVTGSGLPKEDLLRFRVSATVSVGDDRTVSAYSLKGSGNSAFDAAAEHALEAVRGQALPPPPEAYPEIAQTRISVTFVCRENRCD